MLFASEKKKVSRTSSSACMSVRRTFDISCSSLSTALPGVAPIAARSWLAAATASVWLAGFVGVRPDDSTWADKERRTATKRGD